jgi:hypothetical protein
MTTLAEATVKSMLKWKRKPADLYPTPHPATVAIFKVLDLRDTDQGWEPACGRGDIARIVERLGLYMMASDLRHSGFGQGGIDFLNEDTDPEMVRAVFDFLMTNPPFSLAEEFIRRALQHYKIRKVAMLLKSNYWNAAGRLKLWDDCTPTGFYPCTWRLPFLKKERGNNPIMDCDWWVWDADKPPLPCRPLPRPHPSDVPDIGDAPLLTYLADLGEALESLTEVVDAFGA